MRHLKQIVLFFILINTSVTNFYSQGSFNIHFGPSFPLNDFAISSIEINSEDYRVSSTATVGINMGFKYSYQFTDKGIGLYISCDLLYNGTNKEYKETAERIASDMGSDIHKHAAYFNLPLSAGLQYEYDLNDKISLLCNAGLVLNFLKISDYGTKNLTDEFDWTNSVGGKLGGGIIILDKISISLEYFLLGKHNVVGRYYTDNYTAEDYSKELNIHMLTISAGFNF